MKFPRRQFLHLAAGAAALPAVSRFASAQAYPTRPVRLVVGFPPGGATDIVARLMGQWLSERLGQPFIIENRPGAGGNIATQAVINAPPTATRCCSPATANAINATLYEQAQFQFHPRHRAGRRARARAQRAWRCNPSLPAKTVAEFIAYAKANPGKINCRLRRQRHRRPIWRASCSRR